MRKWVVGLGVALFAVSALSTAAFADKKKTYTSTTTTESGVRNVCGKDLQSGGGAMGCTKQCGSSTCDYSCGGPEGKGCRTVVFTRTAPTGTGAKLMSGLPLTKSSGDSVKPKAASVTASPPKASLVSDTGGSASLKSSSKTKSLTDKTTTTTPVTTTGVSR
jgi:hypothetical protein